MAKDKRTTTTQPTRETLPPGHHGSGQTAQGLTWAILGGVVAVLMISFSNWRELDRIEETLSGRLSQIEARVAEVGNKVENLPTQAAQPARRGPDPNRVYTIKTAGAPIKGAVSAPVTIAEFSDFQ